MAELRVDDHDTVIDLRNGETMLAALNRAGYTARVGCRRGGCGICKVTLTEGQATYSATVADTVVTPEERSAGTVLLCRAVPDGDATIAIPPGFKFGCISKTLAALARPKN